MQVSRKTSRKFSSKRNRAPHNYSNPFKLKVVKLHLEEGIPQSIVATECNIATSSVYRWVKLYEELGESGLYRGNRNLVSQKKIPQSVTEKIIETKKNNPEYGVKRISNLLRRVFFLPGSHETVRKTLHENNLMSPPTKKKRQKNITRPRFFERSTPNQLWQTDIFTFRLGGKNAYLLGFIDDFSRYIVSLGCFRSQTAERVLEVYRRGCGEYNPPKEMLTDNGRQYTNWRGTTRFEKELAKDKVKHIRSQPHHPMTLGKIERFWKTIFQEYLSRAQFNSFEDAHDRIQQWIKYYNHKRPHLGIGGLCPADRYFEVHTELRKTIENGVAENALELALRGQPRSPFYMVGRMEGQSVVLKAEKGKLRMTVDNDNNSDERKELVYELNKADINKEKNDGNQYEECEEERAGREKGTQEENLCNGEVPCSTVNLVRGEEAVSGESRVWSGLGSPEQLGEEGVKRDEMRAGASPERERVSFKPAEPFGGSFREKHEQRYREEEEEHQRKRYRINDKRRFTVEAKEAGRGPEKATGYNESHQWRANSHERGRTSGHVPQDILQMGRAVYGEHVELDGRPGTGQACMCGRCGQRVDEKTVEGPGGPDTDSSYGYPGTGRNDEDARIPGDDRR
jgi:transposase InsO family protein